MTTVVSCDPAVTPKRSPSVKALQQTMCSNASDGRPEMQREECKVYVGGRRSSPRVQEYRDFLQRNGVPFRWVDLERDPLVRLLSGSGEPLAGTPLPFFLLEDGSRMDVVSNSDEQRGYTQTLALLAERVGLHVRPSRELYDVVIVGAGPAGLTAAVYAASEGLRTVLLEKFAPGGQAGTSSRRIGSSTLVFPTFPNNGLHWLTEGRPNRGRRPGTCMPRSRPSPKPYENPGARTDRS